MVYFSRGDGKKRTGKTLPIQERMVKHKWISKLHVHENIPNDKVQTSGTPASRVSTYVNTERGLLSWTGGRRKRRRKNKNKRGKCGKNYKTVGSTTHAHVRTTWSGESHGIQPTSGVTLSRVRRAVTVAKTRNGWEVFFNFAILVLVVGETRHFVKGVLCFPVSCGRVGLEKKRCKKWWLKGNGEIVNRCTKGVNCALKLVLRRNVKELSSSMGC